MIRTGIATAMMMTLACSYGQRDKIMHASAGFAIGAASNEIIYQITEDRNKAMWLSIGAGVGAGVGKEWIDRKTTGFDGRDLAATAVGSILQGLVTHIIRHGKDTDIPARQRNKRRG